ncbi:hypothetical protein HX881_26490 [Pseudomonas gingeri]|uniref:Uncharacterized protein n=4 Tax=Pseudomonas gingeri TaxID=117681 RepID=A0A7Y7XZ58_9PSED|nr:hypothetical protein [Pseudomonas gingeri]NVZ29123.1 hypothetical protein [Pseudomonas gingeri]NWC14093.1 hypothetical protein [Pseudomonas gingeri]NWE70279.1 hypothetical protein [Pseudomonas gingeri]
MGPGSISTAGAVQNTEWFSQSGSIKRTEFDAEFKVNQGNIKLLERLVKEVSEVQNKKGGGYLRFNKDNGGLYFSPNRSILETLKLRDGGASEAPQYMKDFKLAEFGKKIKCITIQKNLRECLDLHRNRSKELREGLVEIDAAQQKKLRSVSAESLKNDAFNSPNSISSSDTGIDSDAVPGIAPIPKPRKRVMDRSLSDPANSPQAKPEQSVFGLSNSDPIANDAVHQNSLKEQPVKRSASEVGTSSTPIRPPRFIDGLKDLKKSQSPSTNETIEPTRLQVNQLKTFWENKSKEGSTELTGKQ